MIQLLAYLSPAITLASLVAVSLRWPRLGGSLLMLIGIVIAAIVILSGAHFVILITSLISAVPLLVGLLFFYGRPKPKRLAVAIAIGLPVLVLIGFGAEPVFRVASRFDDGNRGTRLVAGNGVTLIWAPAGLGWIGDGNVTWEDAKQRVRHLSEDGLSLAYEPQEIWRLPTLEEIVRSLTKSNENAGGVWSQELRQATYERTPDKESPLWDPFAPLIYLWTSEEADEDRAWIVVYHGGVFSKPKKLGASSLGFRAVREP